MPAPEPVLELVERFDRNADAYRSGRYNETQIRREFIDPFFDALGWDVDNKQGHAEAYKDVIHEDAIKVGGATKAPDYCFRIGGTRKFFVEAKKPSVDIRQDVHPAYQLRRYAWSAKLPLSILTDFEEFAVYDCRVKPNKNDKASTARTLYFQYGQYPDRWDEIASIFSRGAILKGSFDKYAESARRKRGTAEVDAAFLQEIEGWRDALARNLALRNAGLSRRDLNFAVQRTIDRIIFLRMCEDRGIEDRELRALLSGPSIYPRLAETFRRADERYNSGLFHFAPEKGREPPDELTLSLKLDDKVLRDIIGSLYYPDSPYEFSVLPPEILGHVYEQFLGKVIRLTKGHRAVVEEKPEVKKAGGVYYTPTYIVDYIVANTVGRLLGDSPAPSEPAPSEPATSEPGRPRAGSVPDRSNRPRPAMTPKQAAKLRILDPACGSGSFLLGAYQYLLNWHRDFYAAHDPAKHTRGRNPKLYQAGHNDWRLTTAERKRILLNNIYGVDIDPQAVEVTKLSLLLKVLEGENQQTLDHQLRLYHERALPDLADNIKCGNSLIGPDFYENRQMDLFDEEERYRINAFDWHAEFPEVFKQGGFDAVIGNPPYGAAFSEPEMHFLRGAFESPRNSFDSFLLFMEQAANLLTRSGFLGMIIPSGWTSTPSARHLRQIFLKEFDPKSFVSLPFDVFHGAYIDTVVVTAQKAHDESGGGGLDLYVFPQRYRISSLAQFEEFHKTGDYRTWPAGDENEFLITCSVVESQLISKLRSSGTTLGDHVDVKRGVEVFKPADRDESMVRPVRAIAGPLQRYRFDLGEEKYVDYPEEIEKSKPFEFFSRPRVLIRQVLSRRYRLQAIFTDSTFLTSQSVQSLLRKPDCSLDLRYFLGLINSQLLAWYFRTYNSVARRDDFPKIIIAQTRALPVRLPRSDLDAEKLVSLVDRMLTLHKRLAAAKTGHDKTVFQRQIDATDRKIDALVYELYGLTGDEIRIVEEATGS